MFITFEGTEGTGKSTQLAALAEALRQAGYSLFVTREPGGTAIGDQVRDILSSMNNKAMLPRTEFLLFQSSRAQLVEQELRPRLAQGQLVLCDRYADSTIAYQGYGHQQDLDQVRVLVGYATGGLTPDLSVLLDVDVEVGLKRKEQDGSEWNRLDAYTVEFHKRVRAGYLEMVKGEPERWVVIDAGGEWAAVQEDLRAKILARLPGK